MKDAVSVALSKLIYWYNAPRIQTWPEMVAAADPDRLYASVTEFGRRCGSDRMSDSEHLADYDHVRNLPGLEIRSGRPVLRGVGLLERLDSGYRLSAEGRRLGRCFRENPKGKRWIRCLAKILLTREPRTRVLVRALSRPGAELVFGRPGWFAGALQQTVITVDGLAVAQPFVAKREALSNLEDLLTEDPAWTLGAWRRRPILNQARTFLLTGYKGAGISLDRIGQALKAPFEVLHHLGIITHIDGRCRLNISLASKELGSPLAQDFAWSKRVQEAVEISLPVILVRIIAEIASDSGYVVASQLREHLLRAGIENPDREIAELEDNGQLVIEASSYGQGRHGEGLYGQDAFQLIKIRMIEGT